MKRTIIKTLSISAISVAFSNAQAAVLTFEGLGNLESVNHFYNGGTGGNGSGPGTDLGISFSPNSLAIIDGDAPGGTGNFGGEPSPSTVLFFTSGTAIMNVEDGFDTGFSFFYTAIIDPGSVRVYDGLNGTGSLLATLNLPVTPSNGGDPTGVFSPFVPIGVIFSGIARSVDFGGSVNLIGFDDITIGSASAGVPEPTSAFLGTLSLLALLRRRR